MKFKAFIEGERQEYPARRFAHHIGNVRYWFAVHKGINHEGIAVSHWDSGKLVRAIPITFEAICRGNSKAAAKLTLDKLVESHGVERVRLVLDQAEHEAKGAA